MKEKEENFKSLKTCHNREVLRKGFKGLEIDLRSRGMKPTTEQIVRIRQIINENIDASDPLVSVWITNEGIKELVEFLGRLEMNNEQKIDSILSSPIKGAIYHDGDWLREQYCHLEIPERRRLAREICEKVIGDEMEAGGETIEEVKKILKRSVHGHCWELSDSDREAIAQQICQRAKFYAVGVKW